MKKILFLLVGFTFYVGTTNAHPPVEYRGEIAVGYSIVLDDINRLNLHTVQGVAIGEYMASGLGVGLDYGEDWSIPIYLNVKGFLPVTDRISPYFSFDVGIGISNGYGSSVICTPAVGVGIGRFIVQLGYNVQEELGALQIKTGLVF